MNEIQTRINNSVEEGNYNTLFALITESENINFSDQFGYSLFHKSIVKNYDDISFLLLENSIDVNIKDPKGQTSLHYAAFYGKPAIATNILKCGGDLSVSDIYGNQPLWTAVFNDYGKDLRKEIVDIFIRHGADINHKNNSGKSPYDIVFTRPYENLFPFFNI